MGFNSVWQQGSLMLLWYSMITWTLIQNYQDTKQNYQEKLKFTMLRAYEWCQLLTKDLPLLDSLFALTSSVEKYPSSIGEHHHAAKLFSQES